MAVPWAGGGVLLAARPTVLVQGRDSQPHSARSTLATEVRAARHPGTMAARMASARVDVATAANVTIEMAGCGTT